MTTLLETYKKKLREFQPVFEESNIPPSTKVVIEHGLQQTALALIDSVIEGLEESKIDYEKEELLYMQGIIAGNNKALSSQIDSLKASRSEINKL